MKWWMFLIFFVVWLGYLVIGGLVFNTLEKSDEEKVTRDTLALQQTLFNQSCISSEDIKELLVQVLAAYDRGVRLFRNTTSPSNWDLASAIFFSMTAVTTIGYGNITPGTVGGQIFCVFYTLLGIPITLLLLAEIGQRLNRLYKKLDKVSEDRTCCTGCSKTGVAALRAALVQVFSFGVMMLLPSLAFVLLEEDWSYANALYYSYITLTTIGFGDFVAGQNYDGNQRSLYRLLIVVWIIIGLSWMAGLLAYCQTKLVNVAGRIRKKPSQTEQRDNKHGKVEGNGEAQKNDFDSLTLEQAQL